MSRDHPTDWETMEAIEPSAGDELERVMSRYARVRLEPSPAQVRRARSAVMDTAWRSRIEAESATRRWHLPFASWSARRIALAATAAVFAGLCLGSSAFAASRAGGPLYEARIALENVALPADPAARLQAEIANAQSRLAEAYDAEVRGDQGALTASLNAYGQAAATLAESAGPEAGQALAAVQQHREVLLSLIERAPESALPGLNQALASSDTAIEQLTVTDQDQTGSPGPNGNSGNPGPNGIGGSGGSGSGTPAATPTPTVKPATTPKPAHSPKPAPTPKPAATAKPAHSPKPAPTTQPGATDGGAAPTPAPTTKP